MTSAASVSNVLDSDQATSEDSQQTTGESKKRSRKTLAEMAAVRAAELEALKRKDTTGWTEKNRQATKPPLKL